MSFPSLTKLPSFGVCLGLLGALAITPDTLFMRLSEMDAWVMMVWRGLQMGSCLMLAWLIAALFIYTAEKRKTDLVALLSPQGLTAIAAIIFGGATFVYGIAETSVSIVLFSLACSPLFAAIFSGILLQEKTRPATWVAMGVSLLGIGLTVWGGNEAVSAPDGSVVVGALCGLSTAAALGLNFVMFRARPSIPLLLANGMGAFTTGLIGLAILSGSVASLSVLFEGNLAAISVSGLLILPLSFVALTAATRFTRAANVTLFMLLESVLGPVWVWLGTGERPGSLTIVGGVIVVISLAAYIRLLLKEGES